MQKVARLDLQTDSEHTSLKSKVATLEDLFETQRKEILSSSAETEKHLQKRMETLQRAIVDLAKELNATNPLLLY